MSIGLTLMKLVKILELCCNLNNVLTGLLKLKIKIRFQMAITVMDDGGFHKFDLFSVECYYDYVHQGAACGIVGLNT